MPQQNDEHLEDDRGHSPNRPGLLLSAITSIYHLTTKPPRVLIKMRLLCRGSLQDICGDKYVFTCGASLVSSLLWYSIWAYLLFSDGGPTISTDAHDLLTLCLYAFWSSFFFKKKKISSLDITSLATNQLWSEMKTTGNSMISPLKIGVILWSSQLAIWYL